MNYRHVFHAGNFADCFKHALLVALLRSLARKSAPFFVLDTHAGTGRYDIQSDAARRTAEADLGIRRLLRKPSPELANYLNLVQTLGLYPGSPTLVRNLMREGDRLACCEIHPEDATSLRRLFHNDPQVEVHRRSGWEALGALLPPKEKRGLIFIDPSFEAPDELRAVAIGLRLGRDRFSQGIFAAWYPIKGLAPIRGFYTELQASGIRDILVTELLLREPTAPERLNGCGLIVINPPYQFANHARLIANAILEGVGDSEPGAAAAVVRLADE